MTKDFGVLSILALTALFSCSTFQGSRNYSSIKSGCEPRLFLLPPKYIEYEVIGVCKVKSSSERIAFKKLDKCACKYGGNGLIMMKSVTVVTLSDFTSTTRSTFRGEVIWIKN